MHDILKYVMPKFADDLVALAAGKDVDGITKCLQNATDQLLSWALKQGMHINVDKNKVMLFGNTVDDVKVTVYGQMLENVKSYKYLGVLLDSALNFTMQVDYAISKAERASAKVCSLISGRKGISVPLSLQLYKSLVRPHLEYAIPVWACLTESDVERLENTQRQCLRKYVGAKAHSSSAALEVVCNILLFRIRKRELCCREFIRLKIKDDDHILCQLFESSIRVALRFCQLMYIRVMSKQLARETERFPLLAPYDATLHIPDSIHTCDNPQYEDYATGITVFTHGSLFSGPVGYGACAAVLFPSVHSEEKIVQTCAVGEKVTSFQCEVEGIVLGIKMVTKLLWQSCSQIEFGICLYYV